MSKGRRPQGRGNHRDHGEPTYTQLTALARVMAGISAVTDVTFPSGHEPSMWLWDRMIQLKTAFDIGAMAVCPNLESYAIGTVALWAPDRVLCHQRDCPACSGVRRLTGDADRTCDRCKAIVPVIHPAMFAMPINSVLVVLGLCPGCLRRETPS